MASRINRSFDVEIMLEPGAILPWRSRQTDAGFDLAALKNIQLPPGKVTYIRTGAHLMPPPGYFFYLAPRSMITRQGILVIHGTIDAGYTGEVLIPAFNTTPDVICVTQGDRVAQAIFCPILHPTFKNVNEFSVTDKNHRGPKGFGSSGR